MTGMSEAERRELVATARSVFADHAGPEVSAGPAAALWSALDQLGFVRLGLPEEAGGSGGGVADVAALLRVAGEAAAPVPLAETELAGWLLHSAGLPVPSGPLAVAVAGEAVSVRSGDGGAVATGTLSRVGWARDAARIAVLATAPDGAELVLAVDPATAVLQPGTNLAGEPRDDVRLDGVPVESAPAPAGTAAALSLRAALYRALLLAGAAERALSGSVRYASERVQFGRAIAKFQAVQQQLALAAAEVSAARAAADAAVRVAEAAGFSSDDAALAVAAAKARAGEAAGVVARTAHQVHGAIGFTLEHDLRLATTRLWAWREEDGSDAHWNAEIGRRVLAEGADGLWPLLTRSS